MSICEESQITYTGDGQQVRFTFPFEYLKDTDIEVALWNEFSAEYEAVVYWPDISIQPTTISQYYWTLDNATTVRFLEVPIDEDGPTVPIQPPFDWAPPGSPWPPIATGTPSEDDPRITNVDNIIIRRKTLVDPMIATFYPGSSIRAQDLNDNFEQLQMAIEEGQCVDDSLNDRLDKRYWNKTTTDTDYSTEDWRGDDQHIASNEMNDQQFATIVENTAPLQEPDGDVVGKTWFVNDDTQQLYIWDGDAWKGVKASRDGDTIYTDVFFVSAENGEDENDGHSVTRAKKTIRNAVLAANGEDPNGDGQPRVDNALIFVFPGVYPEVGPIDMTAGNMSIVGQAIRSCFIHPDVSGVDGYDADTPSAPELVTMFRMGSGSYISGFTFAGIKASGNTNNFVTRNAAGQITDADDRSQTLDPGDGTGGLGLPRNQGWVAGFIPDHNYTKSPYIQNCTVFSDNQIDNGNFDSNNLPGEARDQTSSCTGGGILCDGDVPVDTSPLRSFVVDSFTQINLDGPGILCTNNGYAQLVSFFGTFCHYHAKARNGGQLNLSNCTTDFGRFGLIAEGRSATPVITGQLNAAATGYIRVDADNYTAGTTEINVDTLAAQNNWPTTIPGETYLMEVDRGVDAHDVYQILVVDNFASNTATSCDVTVVSPTPAGGGANIGFYHSTAEDTAVRFFRQSYISTGGHTFEFVGSGCDYRAVPELGGQPIEQNQIREEGGVAPAVGEGVVAADQEHWSNKNGGRVWATSTDEVGRFKVGGSGNTVSGNVVFIADQKTGTLTINADAINVDTETDIVEDTNPNFGGNLQLNGWGMGNAITGDNPAQVTGQRSNDVRIYSDTNSDVSLLLQDGNPLTTAFRVPVGTTAQRPGADADVALVQQAQGHIRYNTEEETFEGFDGTEWGSLGGIAPEDIGTGPNQIPTNQQLGQMAFVDNVATLRPFSNTNVQPVFPGEVVVAMSANGGTLTFRSRPMDGSAVKTATITLS